MADKIPPGNVEDRRGEERSPSRRFVGRMRRGVQAYGKIGKIFEDDPDKSEYAEDIERSAREIMLKGVMEELERRNPDRFKERK